MAEYGVRWTTGNSSPVLSLLADRAGKTPTETALLSPWVDMHRCNLWSNGTKTASHGDRCYTDLDVANMGQCMVYIPKFWYKTVAGGGTRDFYIATTDLGGDYVVHPAFVSDGVTAAGIYVGTYEGFFNPTTSLLESVAGQYPTITKTVPQFITSATGIDDGWNVMSFQSWAALLLLMHVEQATFLLVTQPGFNNGTRVAGGHVAKTGHTGLTGTDAGNTTATATFYHDYVPASSVYNFAYHGFENAWGNIQKAFGGVYSYADKFYVADHSYATNLYAASPSGHPYADTGVTLTAATGSKTGMSFGTAAASPVGAADWFMLPDSTAGGSAGTYTCSYASGNGTTSPLWFGGIADTAHPITPMQYYTSPTYAGYSMRLQYTIPP